jgi:hypothetical protein
MKSLKVDASLRTFLPTLRPKYDTIFFLCRILPRFEPNGDQILCIHSSAGCLTENR